MECMFFKKNFGSILCVIDLMVDILSFVSDMNISILILIILEMKL